MQETPGNAQHNMARMPRKEFHSHKKREQKGRVSTFTNTVFSVAWRLRLRPSSSACRTPRHTAGTAEVEIPIARRADVGIVACACVAGRSSATVGAPACVICSFASNKAFTHTVNVGPELGLEQVLSNHQHSQ